MTTFNKRNHILIFMDSVFFTNAMTFLSINAIIPYFLNNLGASIFEISLASVLVSLTTLITQPYFSGVVLKLPFKIKPFVKILAFQRLVFLIFILFIPYITYRSHNLMIILFLVFWGIFNLFVGSYSPFFNMIISKLIPANNRGKLLGFAGAFANILAVIASILIGIILKNIAFPYNYTIIFSIGIIILFIDVWDFILMKEITPDKPIENSIGYLGYLKLLPNVIVGNPRFIKIVMGSTFFVVCNISLAYYALYATKIYNATTTSVAIFTGLGVAVNILANIFFGLIADKLGHKHVLMYASICGFIAGLSVIFLSGIFSVYIAFALTTLCVCGYNLSTNMLIIQEAPRSELPLFISVNVLVTLVISSLIMFLSGFIIENFSFSPIFYLATLSSLGAFLMFKNFDNNK